MLVSLIFVFACLVRFVLMFRLAEFSENTVQGFLIGAVANIYLTDKVAFGKVFTATSLFHAN